VLFYTNGELRLNFTHIKHVSQSVMADVFLLKQKYLRRETSHICHDKYMVVVYLHSLCRQLQPPWRRTTILQNSNNNNNNIYFCQLEYQLILLAINSLSVDYVTVTSNYLG